MDLVQEILDALDKTQKHFNQEGWPEPEVVSVKIHLHKGSDLTEKEAWSKVQRLVENGFVVPKEEDYDEETKIEELNIEEFKQENNYVEPFQLPDPDPEDDEEPPGKLEKARLFAEWLVNERKDIRTVKLDPARNAKQIWRYDREEKVWKRGGEDRVSELLYENMPDDHSSSLEKETKTKVHRINPIHIDETGTEVGEIPVGNGILSLEDLELREIKRTDYLTTKLPLEYDLEAGVPEKFLDFLEDVTRNEEDMRKLQEFIGYCLMTETAKYEKALMVLGPTDSGKSVFLDVVRELLGPDNISQQALQDLTNGKKWGLANLVGKIANIDHDLDPKAIEDVGTVKKITSGNPITVEAKYKQPYDYTPTAKHIFSANRTPARDKEDEAFYNRWLTVVFPESVPREKQNPDLKDELTGNEELKKILCWAVAGYQRLNNQEKFTGENGPYATKEIWKEWGNSIERFISKFMVTRLNLVKQMQKSDEYGKEDLKNLECRVHSTTAYNLYQKYATGMDMEVKSQQAFTSEIKKFEGVTHGTIRINGVQKKGFKGIELVENANKKLKDEIDFDF